MKFIVAAVYDFNWSKSNLFDFNSSFLFFLALCSSSMGFCITSQFWLLNNSREGKYSKFRSRVAIGQVNFIYYVLLYVLTRYLLVLFGIGFQNYNQLLITEYTLTAYLLPTFIFLYNWNMISTVYQSLKAQLLSIPFWLILSYFISFTYCLI